MKLKIKWLWLTVFIVTVCTLTWIFLFVSSRMQALQTLSSGAGKIYEFRWVGDDPVAFSVPPFNSVRFYSPWLRIKDFQIYQDDINPVELSSAINSFGGAETLSFTHGEGDLVEGFLRGIKNPERVKKLYVANVEADPSIIEVLFQYKQLERLTLYPIASSIEKFPVFPKIKVIDLPYCNFIDSALKDALCAAELESLSIGGQSVTPEGVESAASTGAKSLQSIIISISSWSDKSKEEFLKTMAIKHPNIEFSIW